ncbi:MAG: hypothetical protein HYV26_19180 [Candidatus Hydrogenedentes bacterium]|nr:hypothetical protein [Candidatus Hydrogenedentota bacterium]
MKSSGDQFHDTLHQTRVRREIAANERCDFVAHAREHLDTLQQRGEAAQVRAKSLRRDCSECVDKSKRRLEELQHAARERLDAIVAADDEAWYDGRDQYAETLDLLQQEVHTLENLLV